MRALCCKQFGPPETLEFVDVETPTPGAEDVVVDVRAAGVGFVDGLMIQGKYQIKPTLPFFPGGEIAGVVSAVGADVRDLAVGDAVMGLAGAGGYAEQARIRAAACMPKPDALSFAQAAGWLVNYATAAYALIDLGRAQAGETMLVLGASGGTGSAAIAVGNALGVTSVGAASSLAKCDSAVANGAESAVNYSQDNWRDALKATLGDRPLRLVFDPVGGAASEPAFRSLAPGGRFLVIGFASGTIASIPLNLPLLKQSAIVGVDWGGASRADPALTPRLFDSLGAMLAGGSLAPPLVVARTFSGAREAISEQLQGAIMGKLVLEM